MVVCGSWRGGAERSAPLATTEGTSGNAQRSYRSRGGSLVLPRVALGRSSSNDSILALPTRSVWRNRELVSGHAPSLTRDSPVGSWFLGIGVLRDVSSRSPLAGFLSSHGMLGRSFGHHHLVSGTRGRRTSLTGGTAASSVVRRSLSGCCWAGRIRAGSKFGVASTRFDRPPALAREF